MRCLECPHFVYRSGKVGWCTVSKHGEHTTKIDDVERECIRTFMLKFTIPIYHQEIIMSMDGKDDIFTAGQFAVEKIIHRDFGIPGRVSIDNISIKLDGQIIGHVNACVFPREEGQIFTFDRGVSDE